MKATLFGEVLLLVGLLALAYIVVTQQRELSLLGEELGRLQTGYAPVPPAEAPE